MCSACWPSSCGGGWSLKPPAAKPALYHTAGSELPLSGAALLELLRAVLARGVPFRFRAKGWSMAPFIRDGDVIRVAPLSREEPGLGQVVAFVRPQTGSLVVHRIVARHGEGYLLQGDNVPEESDGLVPRASILGRVTRIERGGKAVWLGLGPERRLIAWFSRSGLRLRLRLLRQALHKRSGG
jgi:signal peptidase I